MTAVAFLDGDGQKKYLEASGTGTSGDPYIFRRVLAGGADTITIYNISLASPNTEYSQALPDDCAGVEFWSRNGYPVRFAFETGKVATPTPPYLTLRANAFYESPGMINLSSSTLYFATAGSAGDIIEMIVWS
ncbi:MAG: hypothetical protein GXY44_08410 [Phycisphaerales bacterium]|nr:hypothetical protein [Phycisphaerales bacterium]